MPLSDKQFIDEFDRLLSKGELRYAKKVKKEIIRALKNLEKTLVNNPELALDGTLQTEHALQLKLFQDQSSKEVLTAFITLQANQWSFEPPFQVVNNILNNYTNAYTLELSNLKANTTFEAVKKRIADEITNGTVTPKFISQKIKEVVNITPARSLMIARTEIHNASTYAQHEIAKLYSDTYSIPLYKIWLPIKDKRTRPDHLKMLDHAPVPLNEFLVLGLV